MCAAGYDGLWPTGKADRPVYLWIREGRIDIRDGADTWGLDTCQRQALVEQRIGERGARVAVVGPAGEKGVLFSGIFCDHGMTAGGTGLGAVTASKNPKAIAVRGSIKPALVDPVGSGLSALGQTGKLRQHNEARVLHELGTACGAKYAEYLGAMPAKYFHQGVFEPVDDVSVEAMTERLLAGHSICHGCVIARGRVMRLEVGRKHKGPEYEIISSFGPNLLVSDLETIARLGEACDWYGMDTISLGNSIGLAFRLFEMGKITRRETGGADLRWDDADAALRLIEMTARRQGIGDLIARGARRLAKHFGAEAEAVQVNGQEAPYHNPRSVSGMALVYAASPRGTCHSQSDYFFVDWGHTRAGVGIEYYSRHVHADKAANVARHQDWRTVYNALVMCIFANVGPSTQVSLINAACGLGWTVEEMMSAGERGWNLGRAINHHLGLTAQNDRLPRVFLEQLPSGGSEGFTLDLQGMLYAYYDARGWDMLSGRPSRHKLEGLELEDVARDLWD